MVQNRDISMSPNVRVSMLASQVILKNIELVVLPFVFDYSYYTTFVRSVIIARIFYMQIINYYEMGCQFDLKCLTSILDHPYDMNDHYM